MAAPVAVRIASHELPEVEAYDSALLAIDGTVGRAEKLASRFGGATSAKLRASIRVIADQAREKINKIEGLCARDGALCETSRLKSWEVATDMRALAFTLFEEQTRQHETSAKLEALEKKIRGATLSEEAVTAVELGVVVGAGYATERYVASHLAIKGEESAIRTLAHAQSASSQSIQNLINARKLHSSSGNVTNIGTTRVVKLAEEEVKRATTVVEEAKETHRQARDLRRAQAFKSTQVARKAVTIGARAAGGYAVLKIAEAAVDFLLKAD